MVRVIAPSLSGQAISDETRAYAKTTFEEELGLRVTFSDHLEERNQFNSSSVESRVADLQVIVWRCACFQAYPRFDK